MDAEVVKDLKAYQSILAAGGRRRRSLGHLVEELVRPHLSNSSVAKIQESAGQHRRRCLKRKDSHPLSEMAVQAKLIITMINQQSRVTFEMYHRFLNSYVKASTLCDIRHIQSIRYGWVDCREAAVDWWLMLQEKLDEPKDFEAFRILAVNPLFDTLGTPADLPEYPTPWDRFLENKEWLEMINTVVGMD